MNIEKDLLFWLQKGVIGQNEVEDVKKQIQEYIEIKTPRIEQEVNRMFHEKLIRTPKERLKIAKKFPSCEGRSRLRGRETQTDIGSKHAGTLSNPPN